MLTRIEIDGFKTFDRFDLDVPPFLAVLGPNATGKSNLFDAISLLSLLAGTNLRDALTGVRGEPIELFRHLGDDQFSTDMHLAVEVLLEPSVRDPWGAEQELLHTRFRYEVEIERVVSGDRLDHWRPIVRQETATPILSGGDRIGDVVGPLHDSFRRHHLRYKRRTPLLATVNAEGGTPHFKIHQDGSAGRARPAAAAEATVLSSITTTSEFPHLYAMREELRSWRFLQLDPMELRRPSSMQADDALVPSGANLPSVLARLRASTATSEQPDGVLADVAADLAAIIPGVLGLQVEEDRSNRA